MRLVISWLAISLLCASGAAQEAAYVDVRQRSEHTPKIDGGTGAGGSACDEAGCHSKLRIELVNLTPVEDGGIRLSEWTVHIVNQTKEPISVPTGLAWSSNADVNEKNGRTVLELVISQLAICGKQTGETIPQRLFETATLFGSPKGRSDTTTLESGQWITVVGRGRSCRFPSSEDDTYRFSAILSKVAWYTEQGRTLEDAKPLANDGSGTSVHWNADHDWVKPQASQKQ